MECQIDRLICGRHLKADRASWPASGHPLESAVCFPGVNPTGEVCWGWGSWETGSQAPGPAPRPGPSHFSQIWQASHGPESEPASYKGPQCHSGGVYGIINMEICSSAAASTSPLY